MWTVPLLHRLVLTDRRHLWHLRFWCTSGSLHTRATVFTEAYYSSSEGHDTGESGEREAKDNSVFVVMGHCTGGLSSLLRTECGPPQPSPLMPQVGSLPGEKAMCILCKAYQPSDGLKDRIRNLPALSSDCFFPTVIHRWQDPTSFWEGVIGVIYKHSTEQGTVFSFLC